MEGVILIPKWIVFWRGVKVLRGFSGGKRIFFILASVGCKQISDLFLSFSNAKKPFKISKGRLCLC